VALTYSDNFDGGSPLSGWNVDGTLSASSAGGSLSSPDALHLSGGSPGAYYFATYATQDGNSGNVEVAGWVQLSATSGVGTWSGGPAFRGSSATLAASGTTQYWARIQNAPKTAAGKCVLTKWVSNTPTDLATVNLSGADPFTAGDWYLVDARASGSSSTLIKVSVQRHSDSMYLQSDGSWSSTAADCISYTDSSSPLTGQGYCGLIFRSNDGTNVQIDDFSIAPYGLYFPTVSDTLTLTPAPTQVRDIFPAAAATITLSPSPSEVRDAALSASDTLTLTPAPAAVKDAVASVSATVTVTPAPDATAGHPIWSKSVSDTLTLTPSPSEARDVFPSVSSTLTVTPSPRAVRDFFPAVAATVALTPAPDGAVGSGVFLKSVTDNLIVSPMPVCIGDHYVSAVDNFVLRDDPSLGVSPKYVSVSDNLKLTPSVSQQAVRGYPVFATDNLVLSDRTSALFNTSWLVSASANLMLTPAAAETDQRSVLATATDTLILSPSPSQASNRLLPVAASANLILSAAPSETDRRVATAVVQDRLVFQASVSEARDGLASVAANLILSPSPAGPADHGAAATTTLKFTPSVSSGKDIYVSVSANVILSSPGTNPPQNFFAKSVADNLILSASITKTTGPRQATDRLIFKDHVVSVLVLADPGPSSIAISGISGQWPFTYAETHAGQVVIANGVDPMIIWDPLAAIAQPAGIQSPSSPLALGGTGVGTIAGQRVAFVRFLDANGNAGPLSPVSNLVSMGYSRPIDNLVVGANNAVTITSLDHGLSTGEQVVLVDVNLPINGTTTITVLDHDNFTISTPSSGQWTGGGSWVWGVATVVYSAVPTPTSLRVARRQILRNLDGSLEALYVDIDTPDVTSTSFSSVLTDDALRLKESIPLEDSKGRPWANRFNSPPSTKPIVVPFMGRIWAAGEIPYNTGSISVTAGLSSVTGILTSWPANLSGRRLYVPGSKISYGITSVDVANQILYLDTSIVGVTNQFSGYTIRSAPVERKLVYWSEPGQPEAWPPWNAIAVPEDNDEVVSLLVFGQALCVIEQRHIYRMVATAEPEDDGHLFLMAYRGALNHRCVVLADGTAYMLDEAGIHAYDGNETCDPISEPIQSMFQPDGLSYTYQLDWTTDRTLWHGVLDATRTTIRWFVDFLGQSQLTHAVCYNYRTKAWWLEQYPFPVTSSCTGTVGYRRAITGTECRRIISLFDSVNGDLAPPGGTMRGTVTAVSGDGFTITDDSASFNVVPGSPLTITYAADGSRDTQTVSSITATSITVVDGFRVTPQPGDSYQVSGITWEWESGWLDVTTDEVSAASDIILSYLPTNNPATVDMTVFNDHDNNPSTYAMDWAQDGVTIHAGQTFATFDLQATQPTAGYRVFRRASHAEEYAYGHKFMQFELRGVTNQDAVRLYQISVFSASTSY
jgi:hypothetical protein